MNTAGQGPEDARGNAPHNAHGRHTDRSTLAAIAHRAMIERGLEPEFPPAAQREAAAMSRPADASGDVRDMRDRLWVSIDNDDSRDLDQLTVAEPLAGARVRILVAVADVDALVRRDSAIDGHAAHNTTSVYTPAAIFSMLPEALSTNLTSLNEDEDRIAVVADMVFEADGSLATSDLYRARVRNHGQLAYRSLAAWLDGEGAAPPRVLNSPGLDENLRLQDEVFRPSAGCCDPRNAGTASWHSRLVSETVSPTTRTRRLLRASSSGGARPTRMGSPTSPSPWSSSSGRESTRSICQGASRLDTSAWR